MARKLADALPDGAALIAADGAITLANSRLGAMFGYEQAEVSGLTLESLIPALSHRAASVPGLWTGPEESGARLVGLRRDWTTFPIEVWLSPVITGQLTLAVIRDVTAGQPVGPAPAAPASGQARGRELLDRVTTSLFQIGLILQNGLAQADGPVRPGIVEQALQHLDDTIREIRDGEFRDWPRAGLS